MAKKILVIDDEPDVITYLVTLLEENGYQASGAADGKEGLDRIKASKPDLICLDVLMPEKSGIGLYKELKKSDEYRKIPVIIITGFTEENFPMIDFRKFIYERSIPGPEGYMEKPIDREKFLKVVKDVLER
jgi:two-component system phosphate regulon response regulator PhoB